MLDPRAPAAENSFADDQPLAADAALGRTGVFAAPARTDRLHGIDLYWSQVDGD